MKYFIKRLTLLLIFSILILFTTGCYNYEKGDIASDNFQFICSHNDGKIIIYYFRDIDTDLVYTFWDYGRYTGGLNVYYNSDGQPMKYREFEKTHIKQYHE